jgi:hypothetical protein
MRCVDFRLCAENITDLFGATIHDNADRVHKVQYYDCVTRKFTIAGSQK